MRSGRLHQVGRAAHAPSFYRRGDSPDSIPRSSWLIHRVILGAGDWREGGGPITRGSSPFLKG